MADIIPADQRPSVPSPSASSTSLLTTPSSQRTSFLRLFPLNDGVSRLNFTVYLAAASLGICFFVFINAAQGFVLGQILHIPSTELGTATGSLTFYDELLSLFAVWLWGLASDRIGRRTVYSVGFAIMGIALALFPHAASLYPHLLLYRLLFAIGGAATSAMMTAVMADYASDEGRGKMAGTVGLVSGCGALIALFGLLRLPARFGEGQEVKGLKTTYAIAGGVGMVFAGVAALGLQSRKRLWASMGDIPRERKVSVESSRSDTSDTRLVDERGQEDSASPVLVEERKTLFQIAREGLLAAKDPRVLLGYAGSFLARGDTIILTSFLPLWIYKYYIDQGLCPNQDIDNPDVKTQCREAYLKASALSGVAQTLALIGAPFFGLLLDKLYPPIPLLAAGLLGTLAYILTFISPTPFHPLLYPTMCLVGLAEIGMVVGSLSLVTGKYVPKSIRGSVAGTSSFWGAVGILINTKLGGYVFDHWTSGGPFLIMGALHGVFSLLAVGVIVWDLICAKRERATSRVEQQQEEIAAASGDSPSSDGGSQILPHYAPPQSLLTHLRQRFETRPFAL